MEDKYIKLADLQKFPIRKDHYDKEHGNEHFIFGIETVFDYVDYLPVYHIDNEKAEKGKVKRGYWHLHQDGSGTCSECGVTQNYIWDCDSWQNFCGHCGADMREGGD